MLKQVFGLKTPMEKAAQTIPPNKNMERSYNFERIRHLDKKGLMTSRARTTCCMALWQRLGLHSARPR